MTTIGLDEGVVLPLMVPSSGDAPTLTLAATTLLASVYPAHSTPDEAHALGVAAVDAVFSIWNEIQLRIAARAQQQPSP